VNMLSSIGFHSAVLRFGISISLELYIKIPGRRVVSRIKVRETRGEVAPRHE